MRVFGRTLGIGLALVVLAGTAASAAGVVVERHAGADRYATAAALATTQFAKVDGSVAAAVITTGQKFPDAVTAGAAGFPVILVPSSGAAPQSAKDALNSLNPLAVVVVGGTGAVTEQTLDTMGL